MLPHLKKVYKRNYYVTIVISSPYSQQPSSQKYSSYHLVTTWACSEAQRISNLCIRSSRMFWMEVLSMTGVWFRGWSTLESVNGSIGANDHKRFAQHTICLAKSYHSHSCSSCWQGRMSTKIHTKTKWCQMTSRKPWCNWILNGATLQQSVAMKNPL